MGFNAIYQIAGSAMNAQMLRLNTVASNLANADTAAGSADAVYKARHPVFSAVLDQSQTAASVEVSAVTEQPGAIARYEPNHPLADAKGYVYYPDVNTVDEMADMMSASRSFETNVDVLSNVKSMQQSLLRLGEGA